MGEHGVTDDSQQIAADQSHRQKGVDFCGSKVCDLSYALSRRHESFPLFDASGFDFAEAFNTAKQRVGLGGDA